MPDSVRKNARWGFVKTPSPFKCFFQTLSCFFPLIVFPSAGFTPWSKNSHERAQGKGKGIVKEGKGKNREGKRKGKAKGKENKGSVSHGPFMMSKVIVFVIVLLSFVNPVCVPFFSGNHQKRGVATTYQAPSLCRICANSTTNNERKRPKALNSRRVMEKSRTLDFKSLGTDH